MYFTTKTNTGVYLFLCAMCALNRLSSRCKKEFTMERVQAKTKQGYPGPYHSPRTILIFSCKPKTFPSHSIRVGTRPCCLFICLSKQTKQNLRYQIRGVVARDIVCRFPNIQTKQKIYKKKNNRQTNTKEGRALLFVFLSFFPIIKSKIKTN